MQSYLCHDAILSVPRRILQNPRNLKKCNLICATMPSYLCHDTILSVPRCHIMSAATVQIRQTTEVQSGTPPGRCVAAHVQLAHKVSCGAWHGTQQHPNQNSALCGHGLVPGSSICSCLSRCKLSCNLICATMPSYLCRAQSGRVCRF